MSFNVFIPARFDSSRFPGKPLIDLAGKSMIQRVYEQALKSDATAVYVATDDERIRDAVEGFSGNVIMTSKDHETGTDRIHEAALAAGLNGGDIVVNVQGDEPLMPSAVINQVAGGLDRGVHMSTLKEQITETSDILDANVVKVVADKNDVALYFSRAPIPWSRDSFPAASGEKLSGINWYRHLGIYAYTVELLSQYVTWSISELEQIERLEQLRVLANGEKIRVLTSMQEIPPGIDVPGDLARTLQVLETTGEPE